MIEGQTPLKNKSKRILSLKTAQSISPSHKFKDGEFTEMVCLPHIIDDNIFIARKRTIDTFLKRENVENLQKEIKKGINEDIVRKITEDEQLVLSKKRKTEFDKDEKKKKKSFRGCMFTNELWSENHYNTIISSSYIKSKYDEITNALKGRKLKEKINKTHDLFKKTHKEFGIVRGSVDLKGISPRNNKNDQPNYCV